MQTTTPKLTHSGSKANLWEALHARAASTVKHHLSDFYHDAMWIAAHLSEGRTGQFFYSWNLCGTHIGEAVKEYMEGGSIVTAPMVKVTWDRTSDDGRVRWSVEDVS